MDPFEIIDAFIAEADIPPMTEDAIAAVNRVIHQ